MAKVSRRDFVRQSAAGIALIVPSGSAAVRGGRNKRKERAHVVKTSELSGKWVESLNTLPNFCAHEHWGSIQSVGMTAGDFRADMEPGATPVRRTSVWDLILDPYLGGCIANTGVDVNAFAKEAGETDFISWWGRQPRAAFDAIRYHLERQLFTGMFQCTRRGLLFLHGIDIASMDLDEWMRADEAVGATYNDLFGWYRAAMERAHFSKLIRPVEPEFYLQKQDDDMARKELAFTHTVLRIDPLLGLWPGQCPRRDALAAAVGVEPGDATSWRAFLDRLFEVAAARGAVGIKQLQAYTRCLDFPQREDGEVRWSGGLTPDEIAAFQDWVVNECCKRAHERGWPHQVHVGTHNLGRSSPLPLDGLARRYPNMKLVMIHCWPFLEEAGFLAKHAPNIYIDTCWMPVLSPAFLEKALAAWLDYVPLHKMMCSHDSTSVEMAVGSSLFTREILAEALASRCGRLDLDPAYALRASADMLHNNAVRVYKIGQEK